MPTRPPAFRPGPTTPPAQQHATRATAQSRGYDHTWWLLRNRYLEQHPICQHCEAENRITAHKLIVDHIIPVDVAPELRLNWENLQTLCRKHHKLKTDKDKQNSRAKFSHPPHSPHSPPAGGSIPHRPP